MTRPRGSLTLHVRTENEAIRPAAEQAESWLAERLAPSDASYLVSLAIEELVTNCIKYGYDDSHGHTVDIVLSLDDRTLTMEVIDDGRAFNPLNVPPPDMSLAMEGRPIGGLGLHLVRQLADQMTYERRNNTNRLVLTRRMS